ncbi:MAG: hypothetical protein IPH93_16335 [Saprospiraceae bacterium]|nr:hypothetical protein [Saprospiraceae bacterium]
MKNIILLLILSSFSDTIFAQKKLLHSTVYNFSNNAWVPNSKYTYEYSLNQRKEYLATYNSAAGNFLPKNYMLEVTDANCDRLKERTRFDYINTKYEQAITNQFILDGNCDVIRENTINPQGLLQYQEFSNYAGTGIFRRYQNLKLFTKNAQGQFVKSQEFVYNQSVSGNTLTEERSEIINGIKKPYLKWEETYQNDLLIHLASFNYDTITKTFNAVNQWQFEYTPTYNTVVYSHNLNPKKEMKISQVDTSFLDASKDIKYSITYLADFVTGVLKPWSRRDNVYESGTSSFNELTDLNIKLNIVKSDHFQYSLTIQNDKLLPLEIQIYDITGNLLYGNSFQGFLSIEDTFREVGEGIKILKVCSKGQFVCLHKFY